MISQEKDNAMSRKRYWEDEGRARFWEDKDRLRYRYDIDKDTLPSSFAASPSTYETLSPQLREQMEPMKVALQQMHDKNAVVCGRKHQNLHPAEPYHERAHRGQSGHPGWDTPDAGDQTTNPR